LTSCQGGGILHRKGKGKIGFGGCPCRFAALAVGGSGGVPWPVPVGRDQAERHAERRLMLILGREGKGDSGPKTETV
jgi:hypothetical protein